MELGAPKNWQYITSDGIWELLDELEEDAKMRRYWLECSLRRCCGTGGHVDGDRLACVKNDEAKERKRMDAIRDWLIDKLTFVRTHELAKQRLDLEKKAEKASTSEPTPEPAELMAKETPEGEERKAQNELQT